MVENGEKPITWLHLSAAAALAGLTVATLLCAAWLHRPARKVEAGHVSPYEAADDNSDLLSQVEYVPSPHNSGRAVSPDADDNPFRSTKPTGDEAEESYLLDLEFKVTDVDFLGRIAGEVVDATPATAVVEGTGRTPEEARQDALQQSVRQILTQLVAVEDVLRYQSQIDGEALVGANDFIVSFRPLGEVKHGATCRVRLAAEVDRNKLAERLRKAGIPQRSANE